jgi:hypothetical protein
MSSQRETCCGKRGFDTEREALKTLGQIQTHRRRKGPVRGIKMETRAYECEWGYWHLTSESSSHRKTRLAYA